MRALWCLMASVVILAGCPAEDVPFPTPPPFENYTIPAGQVQQLEDAGGPYATWRFLAGANPGGGAASVRYLKERGDVYVENGWVLASVVGNGTTPPAGNRWGRVRTQRMSGTAEGTLFLVQEQDGVHRALLLSGPGDVLHVELISPSEDAEDLTAPLTFFEVGPAVEALPAPQTISDPNGLVAQLAAYIQAAATQAGF
ncbi:MAG: hypothetical protein AB1716_02135 [Planctomycetota bacterium]